MTQATFGEPRPSSTGRVLTTLCTWFAVVGGTILVAAALMTVVSVAGRYLFDTPIPGDFEMVQIGLAITIFAFLPYCQIANGNVVVDFFTHRASPRTVGRLDAIGAVVYGVIAAVLTWRLTLGGIGMYHSGENTMVLGIALWWGFIPIVISAALLTVVCFYTAWRSLTGRP